MAINLEELEFGAELEQDVDYVWQVTYVKPVRTKDGSKLRLSIGATVAEGPSTGQKAYFAGFEFLIQDDKRPAQQTGIWIQFLKDISKLTGIDPKELASMGVPTEEGENTELTQAVKNAAFLAPAVWQEPRDGYDGSWQLFVRRIKESIDADDIATPDFSALLSD